MEDDYTGGDICIDGSTDCIGNDIVYGSRKKDTWKTIIQVVISVLTAALTALGTTSCMGHGPIYI